MGRRKSPRLEKAEQAAKRRRVKVEEKTVPAKPARSYNSKGKKVRGQIVDSVAVDADENLLRDAQGNIVVNQTVDKNAEVPATTKLAPVNRFDSGRPPKTPKSRAALDPGEVKALQTGETDTRLDETGSRTREIQVPKPLKMSAEDTRAAVREFDALDAERAKAQSDFDKDYVHVEGPDGAEGGLEVRAQADLRNDPRHAGEVQAQRTADFQAARDASTTANVPGLGNPAMVSGVAPAADAGAPTNSSLPLAANEQAEHDLWRQAAEAGFTDLTEFTRHLARGRGAQFWDPVSNTDVRAEAAHDEASRANRIAGGIRPGIQGAGATAFGSDVSAGMSESMVREARKNEQRRLHATGSIDSAHTWDIRSEMEAEEAARDESRARRDTNDPRNRERRLIARTRTYLDEQEGNRRDALRGAAADAGEPAPEFDEYTGATPKNARHFLEDTKVSEWPEYLKQGDLGRWAQFNSAAAVEERDAAERRRYWGERIEGGMEADHPDAALYADLLEQKMQAKERDRGAKGYYPYEKAKRDAAKGFESDDPDVQHAVDVAQSKQETAEDSDDAVHYNPDLDTEGAEEEKPEGLYRAISDMSESLVGNPTKEWKEISRAHKVPVSDVREYLSQVYPSMTPTQAAGGIRALGQSNIPDPTREPLADGRQPTVGESVGDLMRDFSDKVATHKLLEADYAAENSAYRNEHKKWKKAKRIAEINGTEFTDPEPVFGLEPVGPRQFQPVGLDLTGETQTRRPGTLVRNVEGDVTHVRTNPMADPESKRSLRKAAWEEREAGRIAAADAEADEAPYDEPRSNPRMWAGGRWIDTDTATGGPRTYSPRLEGGAIPRLGSSTEGSGGRGAHLGVTTTSTDMSPEEVASAQSTAVARGRTRAFAEGSNREMAAFAPKPMDAESSEYWKDEADHYERQAQLREAPTPAQSKAMTTSARKTSAAAVKAEETKPRRRTPRNG